MNASRNNSDAVNAIADDAAQSSADARRLSVILETYLAQVEQGQTPDRVMLLREHPGLVDDETRSHGSRDGGSGSVGARDPEEEDRLVLGPRHPSGHVPRRDHEVVRRDRLRRRAGAEHAKRQ